MPQGPLVLDGDARRLQGHRRGDGGAGRPGRDRAHPVPSGVREGVTGTVPVCARRMERYGDPGRRRLLIDRFLPVRIWPSASRAPDGRRVHRGVLAT